MEVTNAVYPERESLIELLKQGHEGPVRMLNLLKFRDRAAYEDGRDADISGQQAYGRYGEKMLQIVTGNGGKVISSGAIAGLVIGQVEELWDQCALIEYPSLSEFARIVSLPEVEEIAEHRRAGLAGQLLIPVLAGATWAESD